MSTAAFDFCCWELRERAYLPIVGHDKAAAHFLRTSHGGYAEWATRE